MGSEPTLGSFDMTGQLRTRDDVLRQTVQGMRDEQLRTGKHIVASIDAGNSALVAGMESQTRQLGVLGEDLRGVGDEVLHLRYSLESGMRGLQEQFEMQTRLMAMIATAILSPSSTKAQEFERRAFSLLQRGLLAEARAEATRSLEEEPYQWGAHHLLGHVSEAESALDEAVERYQLAIRYATGVSPQQKALSLGALARMSLHAGSMTEAERYAWDAYRANPTAEKLYTSAVYLAAANEPEGDAGIEQRLFDAVIEHPGLAVLAMAEPALSAREHARDAALIRVRDAAAERVRVALAGVEELVRSLDSFCTQHESQREQTIAFITSRGELAAFKGGVPKYKYIQQRLNQQIASECHHLGWYSASQMHSMRTRLSELEHTLATARGADTIDALFDARMAFASVFGTVLKDLRSIASEAEKCAGAAMRVGIEAGAEAEKLAQKMASLGWFDTYDETLGWRRIDAASRGGAAGAAAECILPAAEYLRGVAKYAETTLAGGTRSLVSP